MIKVGDLVQLKSGSCDMTVTKVCDDKSITCIYWGSTSDSFSFVGVGKPGMQNYNFQPACLVVTNPPSKKEESQQSTPNSPNAESK